MDWVRTDDALHRPGDDWLWGLVLCYIQWSNEQKQAQSNVSMLLNLGSQLSVVPLTIGLLVERTIGFGTDSLLHLMHNFGLLIILPGLLDGRILCKV